MLSSTQAFCAHVCLMIEAVHHSWVGLGIPHVGAPLLFLLLKEVVLHKLRINARTQ